MLYRKTIAVNISDRPTLPSAQNGMCSASHTGKGDELPPRWVLARYGKSPLNSAVSGLAIADQRSTLFSIGSKWYCTASMAAASSVRTIHNDAFGHRRR